MRVEQKLNSRSLLIFGSCVSRDIVNFDESNRFSLVEYYARSSFASAYHPISVHDEYSQNLTSPFQRKTVHADLTKEFAKIVESSLFDDLLIDLIDERFDLFIFNAGGVCTLSNEVITGGFECRTDLGRVVKSGSDEFFKLWEEGWRKFVELLSRTGKLGCIRVNRVFWAEKTANGGDFSPSYSLRGISEANKFLQRLYERIAIDIDFSQFISFDKSLLVGAVDHQWGLSPFHYVDDYYHQALKLLSDVNRKQPAVLSDRILEDWSEFGVADAHDSFSGNYIDLTSISGNCNPRLVEKHIESTFQGEDGTYQFRFKLPHPLICNGVSVRFRLRGWKSLRYIGVGYTHENVFRHVKITNAARGHWVDFSIGHGDITFGLQNEWITPPATEIGDIRLYLRGAPDSDGAILDVEKLWCWRESESKPEEWFSSRRDDSTYTSGVATLAPVSKDLLNVVHAYLKKCFRFAEVQAKTFLAEGSCPLYGETALMWQSEKALPNDLATVGTYQFSWHALHPATILMVFSRESGELSPLFSAREFVTNWLDRSYFQPDPNKKFAWYDHGTAERLLAMVLMWAVGVEYKFDRRFMTRLRSAIFRHGQLLDSELFYASHQPTRYHNHAWFQDIALMATALALPDFPCANRWLETALSRLTDQLDTLIVRDNGFAVFVENSIGYHQGVQRLVEFAGDLVSLTGRTSHIPDVARELSHFSDFLRYPDSRSPAQGDTFRRSNASGSDVRRIKAYANPACAILPKAGYGIVKGNHEGVPFMMTVLATSLCRTHKHEDNLSFTLFFDGLEWLIDPSFYSHEYAAPIPAYLRSAVAHNALVIPGRSYSTEPGVATFGGHTDESEFIMGGEHRAYENVVVKREFRGRVDRLEFDIVDIATSEPGQDSGDLYLMLHCGEQVQAVLDGQDLLLSHPDSRFQLAIRLPSDQCQIFYDVSEGNRIRGVTGLGFMQHTAINTVECRVPFNKDLKWSLSLKEGNFRQVDI